MKILHLTLSLARGGRRQAILGLAGALERRGHWCGLATLEELGCPAEEMARGGWRTDELKRKSLFDLDALRRLVALCDERGVDVIHSHDAASQFTGALVRLARPRTGLLMTFHRTLGFESARWRDRLRNAVATSLSGTVVAASRERLKHFADENWVRKCKVLRIPLGVDLERYRSLPRESAYVRSQFDLPGESVVVGAAGHFGPEKGIDNVIGAWRMVGAVPFPAALVVFGEGSASQRERLAALARRGSKAGPIVFAGYRHDFPRMLRGIDIFVHAPRLEAFGLVLLEAMASGLPVVAVDVGGIPDIVQPGDTGVLVEPENPASLAGAVRRLLLDDALRQRIGLAARTSAEREFALDLCARRYESLYKAVLEGRPIRSGHAADGSWNQ